MTLRRTSAGWVDDARSCITCLAPAPAEPHQRELPERAAELRNEAKAYERLAKERRARADAIDAEIKAAVAPAFLCHACRTHLHDHELATGWMTGRHDASDADFIKRTRKYVKAEAHQPGPGGACLVCQPGRHRHQEEVTA